MARQPHHLLGDVAALGEHRHFLDKVSTVDLHVQFAEQLPDALQQAVAEQHRHLRRPRPDLGQVGGNVVAVGQQFLGHRLAFLLAHGLQLVQRLHEDLFQQRPVVVQVRSRLSRFGHHAGQRQHSRQQRIGLIVQADLLAHAADLLQVTPQRHGVDAEILGRRLPFQPQVNLKRAPADGAANDLLELRLQQVIRLHRPQRDLQVTIVQRPQLQGDVQAVALVLRLAVAGHAEEHANLVG